MSGARRRRGLPARAVALGALLATTTVVAGARAQAAAPTASTSPLPDPARDPQLPRPVTEPPRPAEASPRRAEVGVDGGLVSRGAKGDGPVGYGLGWAVGGHVRVDALDWLGVRLAARLERSPATFGDGALGLPSGTDVSQPDLRRVAIALHAEPQWRPRPWVLLYVGVGAGWGRTTAEQLHTSGAERVVLPSRSAVFVEFPFTLGGRLELLPGRLVVNLSASASLLMDQSGRMLEVYDTPGRDGLPRTVGPFPELTTSFSLLTGLGLLL